MNIYYLVLIFAVHAITPSLYGMSDAVSALKEYIFSTSAPSNHFDGCTTRTVFGLWGSDENIRDPFITETCTNKCANVTTQDLHNNCVAQWFLTKPETLRIILDKRVENLGPEKAAQLLNTPITTPTQAQYTLLELASLGMVHNGDTSPSLEIIKQSVEILLAYGARTCTPIRRSHRVGLQEYTQSDRRRYYKAAQEALDGYTLTKKTAYFLRNTDRSAYGIPHLFSSEKTRNEAEQANNNSPLYLSTCDFLLQRGVTEDIYKMITNNEVKKFEENIGTESTTAYFLSPLLLAYKRSLQEGKPHFNKIVNCIFANPYEKPSWFFKTIPMPACSYQEACKTLSNINLCMSVSESDIMHNIAKAAVPFLIAATPQELNNCLQESYLNPLNRHLLEPSLNHLAIDAIYKRTTTKFLSSFSPKDRAIIVQNKDLHDRIMAALAQIQTNLEHHNNDYIDDTSIDTIALIPAYATMIPDHTYDKRMLYGTLCYMACTKRADSLAAELIKRLSIKKEHLELLLENSVTNNMPLLLQELIKKNVNVGEASIRDMDPLCEYIDGKTMALLLKNIPDNKRSLFDKKTNRVIDTFNNCHADTDSTSKQKIDPKQLHTAVTTVSPRIIALALEQNIPVQHIKNLYTKTTTLDEAITTLLQCQNNKKFDELMQKFGFVYSQDCINHQQKHNIMRTRLRILHQVLGYAPPSKTIFKQWSDKKISCDTNIICTSY